MQRERLSKLKTIPPTEQQTEGDFWVTDWDRRGSTSCLTPWQQDDNGDRDFKLLKWMTSMKYFHRCLLHGLYSSPDIVKMIKSRKIIRDQHVACIRALKHTHFFCAKTWRKETTWKSYSLMGGYGLDLSGCQWIPMSVCFEHWNKDSDSIKG
jgi:hypothetical protein